jgi:hypothetical protein
MREPVDVQHVLRPEDVHLAVQRLVVVLLDPLVAVPVDDHVRRVHQHELVDEALPVAVLADEGVAVEQKLAGDGRPEPVRGRVLVRLVVQQRPGAVRAGLDAVAVDLLVDLQRELADLLGDQRHGRPDGGDAERALHGDALARRRGTRGERLAEPFGRVRHPAGYRPVLAIPVPESQSVPLVLGAKGPGGPGFRRRSPASTRPCAARPSTPRAARCPPPTTSATTPNRRPATASPRRAAPP